MQELEQQAIVLELIDSLQKAESWCGETHIQKCMYFLQDGLGFDAGFDFFLYKHGPFSFDLRDILGEMRAFEFIQLKANDGYGASLETSSKGDSIRKVFSEKNENLRKRADFIATKIAPQGVGVVKLERLGTALFVLREGPNKNDNELAGRINELKPHIPINIALEAISSVRSILTDAAADGLVGSEEDSRPA